MMAHYRRDSDPPEGSRAQLWADSLRPWQSLLTAVLLVWSVVSVILLSAGYALRTPAYAVSANAVRITALEVAARDDRARLDRLEALTMALVQSKCLELDAGSQAITVLPCRELGVAPAAGRPRGTVSPSSLAPSPDWDTLLAPHGARELIAYDDRRWHQ